MDPALWAGLHSRRSYAKAKAFRRYSYRFAKRTSSHEHRRGSEKLATTAKNDNSKGLLEIHTHYDWAKKPVSQLF